MKNLTGEGKKLALFPEYLNSISYLELKTLNTDFGIDR